jgi:hypothetical protein
MEGAAKYRWWRLIPTEAAKLPMEAAIYLIVCHTVFLLQQLLKWRFTLLTSSDQKEWKGRRIFFVSVLPDLKGWLIYVEISLY